MTVKKRYRLRTTKPGTLEIYYGIAESGEPPEIVYGWGAGSSKRDGAFLHHALNCPRFKGISRPGEDPFLPSVFDELEKRGYDLTTLKFSIKKKEIPENGE